MKKNKMYGVDKYGQVYVFDIISEYSDEIVSKIINSQSFGLRSVEFYIKPQENSLFYKIINCSNPIYDYVWKEKELVISKCKDDIIAIKSNILNEYYDKQIKKIEGEIKKLEKHKHSNISFERFDFSKLELNDEVILYSENINKRYNGFVTSLITFDKSNFLPRISCNELDIDNVSIDIVGDVNKLSDLYNDILVFRDNNDLDNYIKYRKNIEIEEDIKDWEWELNSYIISKNRGIDISF